MEHDVSVDRAAAQEMVRRSGQMGVPVITVGDEAIVGFDRRRLEQAIARESAQMAAGSAPKLGLIVRDTEGGVEVGRVRSGSLGDRAGVQAGDVVESMDGQSIRSVADLERVARTLGAKPRVEIVLKRDGGPLRVVMSNE